MRYLVDMKRIVAVADFYNKLDFDGISISYEIRKGEKGYIIKERNNEYIVKWDNNDFFLWPIKKKYVIFK